MIAIRYHQMILLYVSWLDCAIKSSKEGFTIVQLPQLISLASSGLPALLTTKKNE